MENGFGKSNDVQEGPIRKLYTGVENFKVIGVNPTKQELEKMYGRELNFEPEYIGTTEVEDGDGKRTVPQYRLDFYLANEDESITTKVQFYVADTHHKSQTGKYKVINIFGASTWLDQESIQNKTAPAGMEWYRLDGLKVAKRGEEEVISFLINLLNLPYDLRKVQDESEAYAHISKEQWAKIFQGDVSLFKGIIASTNNKVGLLLGVKTSGEGKMTQTVSNKSSARQYVLHSTRADKFKYLNKNVLSSIENGAFGNVDFGAPAPTYIDNNLKEFVVNASKITTSNTNQTDIFETVEADIVSEDNSDWLTS